MYVLIEVRVELHRIVRRVEGENNRIRKAQRLQSQVPSNSDLSFLSAAQQAAVG